MSQILWILVLLLFIFLFVSTLLHLLRLVVDLLFCETILIGYINVKNT